MNILLKKYIHPPVLLLFFSQIRIGVVQVVMHGLVRVARSRSRRGLDESKARQVLSLQSVRAKLLNESLHVKSCLLRGEKNLPISYEVFIPGPPEQGAGAGFVLPIFYLEVIEEGLGNFKIRLG